MILNKETLPRMIDISCVRADVAMPELEEMVQLAKDYRFVCAFSMPCFTDWLAERLRGQNATKVGAAVGFPSGADSTEIKVACAKQQRAQGCTEFDMVMNVGALKSGLYGMVSDDIKSVREVVGEYPLKTILEVAYLTDYELQKASELAVAAGATFIKTGTGWAPRPTLVKHIGLIRQTIGDAAYIKAAGGVRDMETVVAMINEGCSRFGIGIKSIKNILAELAVHDFVCNDVKRFEA